MLETSIKVFRFMQGYGNSLLADINSEKFVYQPVAGMNHPAWIIGHLAYASDRHATYLGTEQRLADWSELFGQGTKPESDLDAYPSAKDLITTWHEANERFITATESATPEMLEAPSQGPAVEAFPTVGDFIAFSMTSHVSLHLGQLAAWRRADGRPAMF